MKSGGQNLLEKPYQANMRWHIIALVWHYSNYSLLSQTVNKCQKTCQIPEAMKTLTANIIACCYALNFNPTRSHSGVCIRSVDASFSLLSWYFQVKQSNNHTNDQSQVSIKGAVSDFWETLFETNQNNALWKWHSMTMTLMLL